ncbi:MAG: hypothetical protein M1404_05745 [Acidobacteria bacterium]|nr:hypothetical protein [Acidobacteriota bacterium]
MKNKTFAILLGCVLWIGVAGTGRTQTLPPAIKPEVSQLPNWLRQGKFRFARFDGGPIEVQKTRRSAWGMRFTPDEQKVLGNVYSEDVYARRMVDLLVKAHVNFVWVTYSVGFSWDDEAPQRALVREVTRMLHEHGIKVAAYMCAVSIFWQSMFRDVPQSVRWIMFDPSGLPYRYSGGRDALRFIADLNNPGWVQYQEKRVGGIIDDGLDAIFFDNTGAPEWASNEAVANFFTKIREYIHYQKKSDIPLFSNFGLSPSRAALNRYMDFTFDEGWREPGVWGQEWNVSNIRRTRYLHGLLPAGKPLVTEYSIFHKGDRSTAFLKPRSEKLAIAEAATFGSTYTWDMEGPFDAGLINGKPEALDSWAAIGQYNGFLANHEPLYVGAANVTPVVVLLPDDLKAGFVWSKDQLLDFLSSRSVLYGIKLAQSVNARELGNYQGVIVPAYDAMSAAEKDMIRSYVAGGGKVYVFGAPANLRGPNLEVSAPEVKQQLESDQAAQKEVETKIAALTSNATHVELKTDAHVLANVTSVQNGDELVLHVLNYDPSPARNVQVRLSLGQRFRRLAGGRLTLLSPDANTEGLEGVRWEGDTVEMTLPSVDVYSVIAIRAN